MSEIRVDTISEKTSANGVSIDGLTIKDGGITATTGAIVFNEASADVDFRVESNGNTHMLFVDGGNNAVGIGNTGTLDGVLHIKGAGDTYVVLEAGATDGNTGLLFHNSAGTQESFVLYDTDDDYLALGSGSAERVRIHSNGVASFNNGIALGVGTANTASNVLDDYEEGTWTIILEDDNDRAFTLSANTGTYIKIGGQVTITGHVVASAINSASGGCRVSGLPFNILGNARNYAAMTIGYAAGLAITAGTSIAGVGIINTANVNLVNFDVAAGTTNLVASKITADGQFIFTMTYTVV